jgi:hypothetical protein
MDMTDAFVGRVRVRVGKDAVAVCVRQKRQKTSAKQVKPERANPNVAWLGLVELDLSHPLALGRGSLAR